MLHEAVRELAQALGRSISIEGVWVVQRCPVCEIDLRVHLDETFDRAQLYKELFAIYDQHRCHAMPDEIAYQRAEHRFVRVSEAAITLEKRGADLVFVRRAHRESDRLAQFVEWFERTSRERIGA